MLEYKYLKRGEIYFYKYNGKSVIVLFDYDGKHSHIRLHNNTFYMTGNYGFTVATKTELRKATPDEARWLRECIKANKFIPFEKIPKTNQIRYEVYI